jgi:sodium-dependent dicarboxylate transporter 2/3/5
MEAVEDTRDGDHRRRITAMVAALVASAVLAAAAPHGWDPGAGLLVVDAGSDSARIPVEVGSERPLTAPAGAVTVELPGGVPTSGEVVVLLGGVSAGVEPEVRLELPDGRSELIPILTRSGADARAVRRAPDRAGIVLGLLGLVVVLWVTEAVPLFVTALIVPVVLGAAGVGTAEEALSPFFHPIIALFFGGFLMAEAMKRVRLDHVAAVSLVAAVGRTPRTLVFGMMAVAAFLSMWMSNTAAAAVLVPIALAVTTPLGRPGYTRLAVLGIAYAATLGGVGSAIGTPANPLAIEFLDSVTGREISFVEWFAFGLPMVALFLPVIAAYLWWRLEAAVDPDVFGAARQAAIAESREAGGLDRPQWTVLSVFGVVMATWLTQTWHGLSTGIVAVGGAVLLALLGKVLPEDLGRISWNALLTFGGGLTLGVFLTESGVSDWIATKMALLAAFPAFVGIVAVASVALALTTVASNTATAAIMIPLAIPLAGVLGVSPVLLVVIVAVASSIDFALVIGTPPTMIAYSTGLFSTREIFRVGIALDAAGIGILVTAVLGTWRLLGVL